MAARAVAAAILAEGGLIHTQHLALQKRTTTSGQQVTTTTNLWTFERETIERVLRDTHWNKSKAAKLLGLTFRTLQYRLEKFGIKRPEDNDGEE